MTRFGWMIASGILLILVGIGAAITLYCSSQPVVSPEVMATSSEVNDPSTLSIYTSGEYGFSFVYPSVAEISDAYTASSTDTLQWRAGATATGTPIVRISLPEGEVRIGNSNAVREIQNCSKVGSSEKSLGAMTMGSTTWSRFSFDKIGTDDEWNVTSYRTIRKSQCFALEVFMPLSPSSPLATSSAFSINDMVQSFTFAN